MNCSHGKRGYATDNVLWLKKAVSYWSVAFHVDLRNVKGMTGLRLFHIL